MATLHIRNVPDDLYRRLKEQAETEHRSLSAEIVALLERSSPRRATPEELDRLWKRIDQRREELKRTMGIFPSSVDLIREDRDR